MGCFVRIITIKRIILSQKRPAPPRPPAVRHIRLTAAAPRMRKEGRTIPIPPTVAAELKKHKIRQAAIRLKAKTWEDHDLVFPTRFGTLQDPCVLTRRFSRLVKAAGISHVSFHDLRHDHASRLFAQGEHPRDVQDRLGHSSITLTMDTYTHAMPGTWKTSPAAWRETSLPAWRRSAPRQPASLKSRKSACIILLQQPENQHKRPVNITN